MQTDKHLNSNGSYYDYGSASVASDSPLQSNETLDHNGFAVNRDEIRAKQDRIIEIAEARNMPFDIPISEAQNNSPTVLQLHSQIWPEYLPSINSFLNTFDKTSD